MHSKGNTCRAKIQPMEWENIFVKPIPDKKLIY